MARILCNAWPKGVMLRLWSPPGRSINKASIPASCTCTSSADDGAPKFYRVVSRNIDAPDVIWLKTCTYSNASREISDWGKIFTSSSLLQVSHFLIDQTDRFCFHRQRQLAHGTTFPGVHVRKSEVHHTHEKSWIFYSCRDNEGFDRAWRIESDHCRRIS